MLRAPDRGSVTSSNVRRRQPAGLDAGLREAVLSNTAATHRVAVRCVTPGEIGIHSLVIAVSLRLSQNRRHECAQNVVGSRRDARHQHFRGGVPDSLFGDTHRDCQHGEGAGGGGKIQADLGIVEAV